MYTSALVRIDRVEARVYRYILSKIGEIVLSGTQGFARLIPHYTEEQLHEQGVWPSKPTPCELLGIVCAERLRIQGWDWGRCRARVRLRGYTVRVRNSVRGRVECALGISSSAPLDLIPHALGEFRHLFP